MAILKLACVILVCLMVAAPLSNAAISCNEVSNYLAPCVNYLMKGGTVPPTCCSGVQKLNNNAKSTGDRQTACQCIKDDATKISGINPANAANLPSKCGVNIPYKISISTNCKNVK